MDAASRADGRETDPAYGDTTLSRLVHALIRAYNGDTLDPFVVPGHPSRARRPGEVVASCYYYSVIVYPQVTLLLDNDGRGGMCDLAPHEIAAAWRTRDVLGPAGLTFDDLESGVDDGRAVPALPRPDPGILAFVHSLYDTPDAVDEDAPGP